MKKLISLVAGMTLIMVSAAPAFCLSFSIDPDSQSITTGDPAAFNLNVEGLGDGVSPSLGAFEVTVNYDESFLEFIPSSVAFGEF